MNRIIKSVVIGVMLGLAFVWLAPGPLMAQSKAQKIGGGTKTGNITVASSGNWGSSNVVAAGGACGGRLSTYALKSLPVAVPPGMPFTVILNCDKGLAADGDSCIIVIETQPDNATEVPTAARSWTYLTCASSTADSTDYPMVFHFSPDFDSVNTPVSLALASVDGGGHYYCQNTSLGTVRISINGPQGDSLADAAGRWPWIITW